MYDINNVFYKILQHKIPAKIIFENNFALAFLDINPQAKIHCLVIPKGQFINFEDFIKKASPKEIIQYYQAIDNTIELLNITDGFRLITNNGLNAGQEVPHFHTHILAGEPLAPLNKK
jgi:histidine triad (HIT) family protein